MEAKERLKTVALAGRSLDALLERQRRYRELAQARGGRSPRLEALEREIAERIEVYADQVSRIERQIDALANPLQREVLRYRYLNGWSWQAIAVRTGLSKDWLWRQHALALEKLEDGYHSPYG